MSDLAGNVCRILTSRHIAQHYANEISDAMQGAPTELVCIDDFIGMDVPQVDIAFFSRDIYAASSRNDTSPATRAFFRTLTGQAALRWIHVFSAGVDRPVYRKLWEQGVRVSSSSGAASQTVAHSALCGILALARQLPAWMDAQRRRSWEPMRGERSPPDLVGQTAAVVGLGRIGKEIAKLLTALGLKVIGVQRRPGSDPYCNDVDTMGNLPAILPRADWVILSCPLTEETAALFDANAFAAMKRGARLINVAR